MKIRLNGEEYETKADTVGKLLDELKIFHKRVAVEVNLNVIKRNELKNFPIKEGDVVEIVNFVGGG